MARFFQLFLVFIFICNSGCIHVSSTEHKTLEFKTKKQLQEISGPESLRINSVIYTESVFPLEIFLKKLLAGDFNEAVRKVNLSYTPSNVDNQLISELITEGLIPVYVKIENKTAVSVEINEKNFIISDETQQVSALGHSEIPRAFTRFNSRAVAANAYNIGAVAITYIGALVAVGIIASQSGSLTHWGYLGSSATGNSFGSPSDNDSKNTIINRVEKTTVIDYQNYLIGAKTIEPFSAVEGLLFFRLKSKNPTELKLAYK